MNRQSVRTHFRRVGIVVSTMWSRGTGRFSLIVLGLWVLVSLVSLFWTPRSLWQTDGYNVWAKPSREHWLGTDGTGADVLSWLMAGSRTNLAIVVLTVCFALAFGLLLVSLMVSHSTLLANGTVVAIDALISIPTVLIALMLRFWALCSPVVSGMGSISPASPARRPCFLPEACMWSRRCRTARLRHGCSSRMC